MEDYQGDYEEGGHSGFGETAYIMGIHSETVKMDRLGIVSGKIFASDKNSRKLEWRFETAVGISVFRIVIKGMTR